MPENTTPTENNGASPVEALPEKPKSNGKAIGIGAAALVVLVAAGFGVKALTGSDDDSKLTKITVGTTEGSEPYWAQLIKLGKENGLDIKKVDFTDYTQANPALAQGQIDLNQFQHLQFLANYNVSDNKDLTPVGSTYIVPLSLFSKKHTAVSQIGQGGKIAIPNDPTNQARALLLLQKAGLLKLKGGGNSLSTPADIDKAASKVTVTPVAAEQTAAALPSVDGSVVNNNFVADANLDPTKALYKDDPKSKDAEPYINVIVARKSDAKNEAYAKFVKLYHDPSVEKLITEQTKGSSVLVNRPASQLQSILSTLEAQIKAKK